MLDIVSNIVRRQEREIPQLLAQGSTPRSSAPRFRESLTSALIKVITGPRRAGKSTFALQALRGKRFAYLNFEDESFPSVSDGDLILAALDSVYGPVDFYLFDEIQNFARWQQFVNRLHRLGKNVIVTGSNARLLSDELATALTGRHIEHQILPFSFRESLGSERPTNEAFIKYLVGGGFPEVVLGQAEYRSYLSTLWDSIVLKDIAQRKKVRNMRGLSDVLNLGLSSMASRFNAESLTRALNQTVSAPSTQKFFSYGVEAYLLAELAVFSPKQRRRIKSDRKAYTIDGGFFSARHVGVLDDQSRLFENAVFLELWRRGYRAQQSLFYYQTKRGFEVDFLLREGSTSRALIQVSYALSSQKTLERELRALVEASNELDVDQLTVITLYEERTITVEGKEIRIIPAIQWFCQEEPSPVSGLT